MPKDSIGMNTKLGLDVEAGVVRGPISMGYIQAISILFASMGLAALLWLSVTIASLSGEGFACTVLLTAATGFLSLCFYTTITNRGRNSVIRLFGCIKNFENKKTH